MHTFSVFYSIAITPSAVGTPTAGDTYSLNCSISGTTNPAIYNWFASNGAKLTNISQLLFSSLMTSDAGLYTCRATVGRVVVEKTFAVNINRKCMLWYNCIIKFYLLYNYMFQFLLLLM